MELYYFNITPLRNRNVYDSKIKEVDEERRAKIERLRKTDDKLRSLGAGLLIEYIRKKYYIMGDLESDKFGKLHFKDSNTYFNISHSGNYVVAAVSRYNVGVDIQRIQDDGHRIAERNFLASECNYINETDDEEMRQQRFCEVWTVKEAYLKNIGIGLRKPLNSFEVDMSGDSPKIVGEESLKVVQIKMDGRYIIAVCTDVKDEDFQVDELTV
jgi:4'-phosphopantetheinyl transferase